MSSSYRLTLENFLKELDIRTGRLVDIGGSQLPLKGRTKSWDVGEYVIADLSNPHVDSPKPDFVLDLNNPNFKSIRDGGMEDSADIVTCFEVFEYVYDPVMAFTAIHDILKPGGVAWVSFPAFYPHHNPVEDDSLRYMRGGIERLANATGLQIKQIIPRRAEAPNVLQGWFAAERMRPAKGFDHNVMGWFVEFTK